MLAGGVAEDSADMLSGRSGGEDPMIDYPTATLTGGKRATMPVCTSCGEPDPQAVFDGSKWNFLCLSCGSCTHAEDGVLTVVNPLACHGCRLRDYCLSSPSPLARAMSRPETLQDGRKLTLRPLVHSDLPLLCGLAARARAEAGGRPDARAQVFCETSDADEDSFALLVFDDDRVRPVPVALASFERCKGETQAARVALAIDSAFRSNGLAELLLKEIISSALSRDIGTFFGDVELSGSAEVGELLASGLEVRETANRNIELRWHGMLRAEQLSLLGAIFDRRQAAD